MANIPVEKESSTPWWLWLLGALLLGLLVWLLVGLLGDDEEEIAAAPVVAVEPVDTVDFDCPAVGADVVTSIDQLMAAGGADLVGCQVDLNEVRVLTLTGDSSFFVAPGLDPAQGMLVVLQGMNESESLPPPPTGADGTYNVDEGDVVTLDGEVAAFDASVPDYADLPAADRDRVLERGLYINARSLQAAGADTEVLTPGATQPETM